MFWKEEIACGVVCSNAIHEEPGEIHLKNLRFAFDRAFFLQKCVQNVFFTLENCSSCVYARALFVFGLISRLIYWTEMTTRANEKPSRKVVILFMWCGNLRPTYFWKASYGPSSSMGSSLLLKSSENACKHVKIHAFYCLKSYTFDPSRLYLKVWFWSVDAGICTRPIFGKPHTGQALAEAHLYCWKEMHFYRNRTFYRKCTKKP